MPNFRTIAATLGLSLYAVLPADAAIMTRQFNFNYLTFDNGAPTDPVLGSVTVVWDTSVNVVNQITGITLNSLNIPLDFAIGFNYATATDIMLIGGWAPPNDVDSKFAGTNDFFLRILDASTTPIGDEFSYTSVLTEFHHFGASGSVVAVEAPEPASLALFGVALAGAGLARRRYRRAA